MTEIQALEGWLHEALTGDAGVVAEVGSEIHADFVPQTGAIPALVWQVLAGEDVNVQMGDRCGFRALVQIKAVGRGLSRAGLYAAVEAAEAVVRTEATFGGFEIDGFRRDLTAGKFEDEGVVWNEVVGVFELWVRAVV